MATLSSLLTCGLGGWRGGAGSHVSAQACLGTPALSRHPGTGADKWRQALGPQDPPLPNRAPPPAPSHLGCLVGGLLRQAVLVALAVLGRRVVLVDVAQQLARRVGAGRAHRAQLRRQLLRSAVCAGG